MRRTLAVATRLLLALAGCHDFDTTFHNCVAAGRCSDSDASRGDGGVSDGGPPDAGPPLCDTSPLSGLALVHRGLETGTVTEPASSVEVLATCDGGWLTLPAPLDADGGFALAQVPTGPVFLRLTGAGPDAYVQTPQRSLTLDLYALGRAGARTCDAGTLLAITVNGMDPWPGILPDFGIVARNAGIAQLSAPGHGWVANPPANGDTSLNQATFNFCAPPIPAPLIDAAAGDVTYLYQSIPVAGIGANPGYVVVSKVLRVPNLVVVDGQPGNAVSGTMTSPPPWGEVQVQDDAPAFEALLPDGPGAAVVIHGVAVGAEPVGVGFGARGRQSTSLVVTFEGAAGAPRSSADMLYPNPYGSGWEAWAQVGYGYKFTSSLTLPDGGTVAVTVEAAAQNMVDASALAPAGGNPVMGPLIGPVRQLRVNGADGNVATAGVGLTPTVSWTAPVFGTPTLYLLEVLDAPALSTASTLTTHQTSVQLPPGMLRAGAAYVFLVLAVHDPAGTPQRPLAYGYPSGFAMNATAVMAP